ncbi:glucuronyl esterase domain-containing protein [Adhaeretor mobilis]|nr:acetylxylan esterase [Adhaeretor mobilis]
MEHLVSRAFCISISAILASTTLSQTVFADKPSANYDEAKAPSYTLPDPLIDNSGKKLSDVSEWKSRRREILNLFEDQVYGRIPAEATTCDVEVRVVEQTDDALQGKARRIQFEVAPLRNGKPLFRIGVLTYLPLTDHPAPCFLALNFFGNQSVHADPEILLNKNWIGNKVDGVVDGRVTEAARGVRSTRWDVEEIIGRGYGLVTAYYGDIDPDRHDFTDGAHSYFYSEGQTAPAADEWGSIAAWAWGLSKIRQAIGENPKLLAEIDSERMIVFGHSRLGKTALWAGAIDPKFAMIISNDSGCGGAALSSRAFGETVGLINRQFPHWFCDNFNKYNENESALPVDQHELIALCAPRPVYVASAQGDRWADPRGEFLACLHASPVYELLGVAGLPADKMPMAGTTMSTGRLNYHIRPGGHDVQAFDWRAYLTFADRLLPERR